MRATKAIIHLDNFRYNYLSTRQLAHKAAIAPAMKANAYGHGAVEIAREALAMGARFLCVATVGEGRELREEGIEADILLLSPFLDDEIDEMVDASIIPLLSNAEMLPILGEHCNTRGISLGYHLKIDTGMGRVGLLPEQLPEFLKSSRHYPSLRMEGICTHMAGADMETPYTAEQLKIFRDSLRIIRKAGFHPEWIHAANSGAILAHPDACFNMVRPGIILYGYLPDRTMQSLFEPKPVMELETRIMHLKTVAAGTAISYGMTYRTANQTRIATLPVGYGDGYFRHNTGRRVCINGRNWPVVGRICMDMCMVDVGMDAPIRLFDRAVLFGPDAGCPDADDVAASADTIAYEITTALSPRVPRVYRNALKRD